MLTYCQLEPQEKTSVKFQSNKNLSIQENAFGNIVCQTVAIFTQASMYWV